MSMQSVIKVTPEPIEGECPFTYFIFQPVPKKCSQEKKCPAVMPNAMCITLKQYLLTLVLKQHQ